MKVRHNVMRSLIARFKYFSAYPPLVKRLKSKYGVFLTALLIAGYMIFVMATFHDYGITYDEEWKSTYGKYIYQWYRSGFQDRSAINYWILSYQPGFSYTIAHLVTRISPLEDYHTYHLVVTGFAIFGLIGVYKLANRLAGPWAGFFAVLMLLFTPRFTGDAFNNLNDVPFASLTICTIYILIRWLPTMPQVPNRLVLSLGLIGGLTLSIRIGGILLIFYGIPLLLLWINSLTGEKQESLAGKKMFGHSYHLIPRLALVSVVAYLVLLIFWPAAQVNPIKQPLKGLLYSNRFEYEIPVFFEGQYISNFELPWYYLPHWFLDTLPEFFYFTFIAGLTLMVPALLIRLKNRAWQMNHLASGILLLIISVTTPILYSIITSPTDYDGIRHYLFIVPSLAVLGGISVVKFLEGFRSTAIRLVFSTLLFGSLALTFIDMVHLHPYQYIYFNRLFAGGMVRAAQNFETDYWGASYKEGVEWLVNNYPQTDNQKKINVASCMYPLSTSYYLPEERFDYLGSYEEGPPLERQPDIILATTRWDCNIKHPGEIIHTVSRMKIPLLYIIRVTPSPR